MEYVIQVLAAFAASAGFALLFHVRREKLLLASFGGMLAWGVYLLAGLVSDQDVARYFLASVALTVYSEVLARVVKCPATVFLVTAAIPLVPGGGLYATMQLFLAGDFAASSARGLNTLLLAVAIALGMLFPTSLFYLLRQVQEQRALRKKEIGKHDPSIDRRG